MKLKTFKDLEIYHQDRVLLKQEAIKHINYLKNKKHPKHLIKKDKEAQAFSEGVQSGIIGWIKQFFNITKDDLK